MSRNFRVTSGPRDCPACGLLCPPTAVRCDCGYDFQGRAVPGAERPLFNLPGLTPRSALSLAKWLLFGLVFTVAGIGTTANAILDGPGQGGHARIGLGMLAVGLACLGYVWFRARTRPWD